jgi:hypothetical protein
MLQLFYLMSQKKEITLNKNEQLSNFENAVPKIIPPKIKSLSDGFNVRRLLPHINKRTVGPFVFFDHMGPAELGPDDAFDVRPHPHINLATVTYLFDGEILHKDSLGSDQLIRPGEINLMVSGKGIVHSERERLELKSQHRKLHGLQLWIALPEEFEEIDPAFYHYKKEDIPSTTVDGVPVRVLMGSAYGLSSPVKTYSNTLYAEARLRKGQSLDLPNLLELAVYTANGSLKYRDADIQEHHLAVFNEKPNKITALEDSFVALIGGSPLTKRYIEWNFVSSRKERIEKAKEDWKNQNFPKVPGDSEDFIPLPE